MDCSGDLSDGAASEISSSVLGEIKDIMMKATDLLSSEKDTVSKKTQRWEERTAMLNESWAESRASLYETLLKVNLAVKEETKCMKCLEEPAVLRCNECSGTKYLCGSCDQNLHELLPFHDRDAVINGHYQPIPPTLSKNSSGEWITIGRQLPHSEIVCPVCNVTCNPVVNQQEHHCIVVSSRGRFDLFHRNYQCQKCQKVLSTSNPLVICQLGFWPGSIRDATYVFHQDMFLYWDILQKQMPGVSERSFVKSLELFSKQKGRVATINLTTFASSFKEWKFCQFELDRGRQINWMECPACDNNQHSIHVDGNMKLYRFKSAGVSKRECYYGETFIASNAKVDSHIHTVYQGVKHSKENQQKMCGDSSWHAAGNSVKKKKNLSETGLEIAGCRHSIAQHAVNMMYGEVYGYAHYMQLNYFIPKNVKFFWYDVVCKYWPWVKKRNKEVSEEKKPALSVMHAKAHAWYCQVLWGGRWQKGAGATTGEEVEQINSHFSRVGSSTKHMLPEGREELLTEHALQWNRRIVEGLPQSLAKRYKKTQNQLKKACLDLDEQLKGLHLNQNAICFEQWKSDVLLVAKDSSKQRTRLRNKISKEKAGLEKTICKYNQLVTDYPIQKEEIERGYFLWKGNSMDTVPVRTKRLVVDRHMEVQRFKEELNIIEKEMLVFMKYYKDKMLPSLQIQREKLLNSVKDVDASEGRTDIDGNHRYFSTSREMQVVEGKLALIAEGIAFVMKQIAAGIVAFAPVLNCELNAFRKVLLTNQPDEVESDGEDTVDDGDYEGDDCSDEDFVMNALEKLTVDSLEPVLAEDVGPVSCWRLPSHMSQGRYKGRNGSNACSLISLMIGYVFYKTKTRIPSMQTALSDNIISVVCGSMELGNRVYDLFRHNLPSRYLSIEEAASVLDTWLECSVGNTLPVRLQDPHEMSTVSAQLSLAMASQDSSFSFLIMNEKTSFFFTTKKDLLYIDTHSHSSCGAVVIVSESQNIVEFCKAVWDLEGHSEKTFGNLVFVDFQ